MGENEADRRVLVHWEMWFAHLKVLIENGQVHIEVRHALRDIGYETVRWKANAFEANGGPVVIVADLEKPPHTWPDEDKQADEGGA